MALNLIGNKYDPHIETHERASPLLVTTQFFRRAFELAIFVS